MLQSVSQCLLISIHALCEEGDPVIWAVSCAAVEFLSTPSARRATFLVALHKPRHKDFYPRPLRGGRPYTLNVQNCAIRFLSTPSARRATPLCGGGANRHNISIHALCEEGDP